MNSVTLVVFHLLLATAFRLSYAAVAPGSVSPVSDPNSEQIRKMMASTLGKTNSGYTLSNVKQCTSQIVAGWKYDCEIEVKSPNGQTSTCRLAVVQRPWVETDKEVIVADTCSSLPRAKREVCAGCPYEVDANDDDMKNKLTGVLSETNSDLTLVKGTHCVAQVVAGIKYDCTIQVESPRVNGIQTCKLSFVEQPWMNPKVAILEDTCNQVVRNKRAVCAGCPEEHDADTPEMKKKLTGILGQTNSGLTLVDGNKCTTQVVAGIKYICNLKVTSPKINGVESCTISFLEQPWISPDPQILSDTCSQLTRNKRAVCAGCPIEQDANTPEMEKTLKGILGQTNSGLTLVKGKKCTSQVVSGIKYTCTLEVTSPKINGVETCTISYLEQPWINPNPQILSDSCSQLTRNKRAVCAGCPIEQDANTPEMEKTLKGILGQTNSGLTLVKGKKCTSQVVSGIKYTCTLEVTSPKINGVETCTISYLEQPWINPNPQILSDSCSQLTRNKREVCAGCPIEQDPHDPEMEKKMKDALSETNSGVGLVGVEKCTSQVVAGVLYDCTIHVNSPHFNGVETCKIQLLEQPWISKKPQVVGNTCAQLTKA